MLLEELEKMKTITIFEPHCDDALLSLYCHIEDWINEGYTIDISTVFTDGIRSSEKYCKFASCAHSELLMDSIKRFDKDDFYQFKKIIKEEGYDFKRIIEKFKSLFSFEKDMYLVTDSDIVLLPLSIVHPEHFFVRDSFKGTDSQKVFYYADVPYCYKKYGKDSIKNQDIFMISEKRLSIEKIIEKMRTFELCYPTESMSRDWPIICENYFAERIYV